MDNVIDVTGKVNEEICSDEIYSRALKEERRACSIEFYPEECNNIDDLRNSIENTAVSLVLFFLYRTHFVLYSYIIQFYRTYIGI